MPANSLDEQIFTHAMKTTTTPPGESAGRKQLTPKQAAFCAEFLVDMNGTQAAIRAGYSAKTARQAAAENLSKPDIQKEVTRLMNERAARVEIDMDTILQEMLLIARSDIGEAFNEDGSLKALKDIPENVRRAIAAVEVFEVFEGRGEDRAQVGWSKRVKLWDKPKALDMLYRHLNPPANRLELTGKGGGPILTASAEREAQVRSAEEICALVSTLRESIENPDERRRILSTLPPEAADLAGRLEAAARIAANVEPPASFRGDDAET